MFEPLRLMVLTPVATLLDVTGLRWVQVRLADGGGLGIFPGHAPLLAETAAAPLRYADVEGEHVLELDAGILQITASGVTLFTSGLRAETPAGWNLIAETDLHFERLALALRQPLGKVRRGARATAASQADD